LAPNLQGGISDASSGGVVGDHAFTGVQQFLVGAATEDQFNTVHLPLIPIACWGVDDVRFAFDSSFVDADCSGGSGSPEDIRMELAALKVLIGSNPGCPLCLFGHADPVGDDAYNKSLSERRARAIYSLLIFKSEPETALSFWQNVAGTEKWGSDQQKRMQTFTGESSKTGKELMRSYMQKLSDPGPALSMTDFLAQGTGADRKGDFQGCSEFNPLLVFSQEKQAQFEKAKKDNDQAGIADRNAQNAVNRRVLALMFRKGSRVDPAKWPCPRASQGIVGCTKRFWSDGETRRSTHLPGNIDRRFEDKRDTFGCRFYQRLAGGSPCDSSLKLVRIRLFDHLGQPIPNALYKLDIDGAQSPQKTANEKGDINVRSSSAPESCRIRWSRPLLGSLTYDGEDAFGEIDPGTSSGSTMSVEDTAEEGYEYMRDIFLDVDGSVTPQPIQQNATTQAADSKTEQVERRLNNLGYSSPATLEGKIQAFQKDSSVPTTGSIDDASAKIIERHDQRNPPSPGKLRTLSLSQDAQ
jgi:hypothetical protein